MNNSQLKPFLVHPELETAGAKVLDRSTDPKKRRILSEILELMELEKDYGLYERHPLHPFLRTAVRESNVRVVGATAPELEQVLRNLVGEMRGVHLAEPQYEGNHPCDFDETCLMAGILGPEVQTFKRKITAVQGQANEKAVPKGLVVARHFSPTEDLALIAVRRMSGPDGQYLSGPIRSHYDDFFAKAAW